jgi:catechol 2,3-dioxygenase-like lactoylglutathione lyase family enzyme
MTKSHENSLGGSARQISHRIDHVAVTVPDLEAATTFFADLFGARELYRLGPFDAADFPPMEDGRDWSTAYVNVPGARFVIAMLLLPGGMMLELFEYELPTNRRTQPPSNHDIGGHHLAFKVADIEVATRRLKECGLTLMAGPIEIDDGPAAGTRVQYFLSPWGLQLELIEYVRPPWTTQLS